MKEESNETRADSDGTAAQFALMLIGTLENDYSRLHARLALYFGSSEAATEALHDTYVKLRSVPIITDLRYPRGYLYRMAINLAANNRRRNLRATTVGRDVLEALPDPDPGPERTAAALQEVHQALEALHMLPETNRRIFLARWRDNMTIAEIASLMGMHKRSVQKVIAKTEAFLRSIVKR